jgi:hypothetical protein
VNTAEELSNQHIHSTTGADVDTSTGTTTAAQQSVDDGSGSTNTNTSGSTSSQTLTAHPYAGVSRSELLSRLRAQYASGNHYINCLMLPLLNQLFVLRC